jgi:hypothetical protein
VNNKSLSLALIIAAVFGCLSAYNIGYGNGQRQYAKDEYKRLQNCMTKNLKAIAPFNPSKDSVLFGIQICLNQSVNRLQEDAEQP